MNKLHLLLFICIVAISSSAHADKTELKKLEKQCADAREKKIAPLRKDAIKECAEKDRSTRDAREKCERFYADFGESVRYKNGSYKERMFNNLPICLEFYEAERKYKTK